MFNIYGHKAYDSSDINNIYVYESIVNLVIIQHPKITVRILDDVLAFRTYYNSYFGADKARSASGPPRDEGCAAFRVRDTVGFGFIGYMLCRARLRIGRL